jgi:uncharacterized protein YdcH (DUF465 family)
VIIFGCGYLVPAAAHDATPISTHRAKSIVNDSAWCPQGDYLMENHTQDEITAHLLATDEHFRSLHEQHTQMSKVIDEIEAKGHVTAADELEEQRLKKLKLHLKDEMNQIRARSRSLSVS